MKYNGFYFRLFRRPMKRVLAENTAEHTPRRS